MKKSNLIYKLVVGLTFVLPTSMYLLISAIFFSITPDVIFYNVELTDLSVQVLEDDLYAVKGFETAQGHIKVIDNEVYVLLDSDDIIKIGFKYYMIDLVENVPTILEKKLVEKETSYRVPISIFIALFGLAVSGLIVSNKMQVHKTRPRLATWIALFTTTIMLALINLVVSNMLGVFITVLISWTIYCLEYLYVQGKISGDKKEQEESELIKALSKALGK